MNLKPPAAPPLWPQCSQLARPSQQLMELMELRLHQQRLLVPPQQPRLRRRRRELRLLQEGNHAATTRRPVASSQPFISGVINDQPSRFDSFQESSHIHTFKRNYHFLQELFRMGGWVGWGGGCSPDQPSKEAFVYLGWVETLGPPQSPQTPPSSPPGSSRVVDAPVGPETSSMLINPEKPANVPTVGHSWDIEFVQH